MACMSSVLLTDDRNEGNNQATIRCQLAEGHAHKHRRSFTRLGKHASKARSSSNGIATSTTPKTLMSMKSAAKDDTAVSAAS